MALTFPGPMAIEMKLTSAIAKKMLLHVREIIHQLGIVNSCFVLL
jgi:hypothetical protein